MGRYEAQKQLEGWIEDDMDVRCFCNVCFLCFFIVGGGVGMVFLLMLEHLENLFNM